MYLLNALIVILGIDVVPPRVWSDILSLPKLHLISRPIHHVNVDCFVKLQFTETQVTHGANKLLHCVLYRYLLLLAQLKSTTEFVLLHAHFKTIICKFAIKLFSMLHMRLPSPRDISGSRMPSSACKKKHYKYNIT